MTENRVYSTVDMIRFRVIDLVCHLFLHFFSPSIFHGTWEATLVINEPQGVHSPHPPNPTSLHTGVASGAMSSGCGRIVMFSSY